MAKEKKRKTTQARKPAAAVDPRYLVPALRRGLEILAQLSGERRSRTLSEIASALKITRSSTYRLLYTLEYLGFVVYDPGSKSYTLGSEVLSLGYGFLASRDLVEVAMPHLVRLRDRTGWSAHLGELSGRDVVYLARVATRRSVASTVHIGTRLPARSTTMGRILLSAIEPELVSELYRDDPFRPTSGQNPVSLAGLLAQLEIDRAAGVVVQPAGYEPGVASIAAPIRDMTGRVVAAINISIIALFTNETELNGPLRAEVLGTAEAISRDLGFKDDPALIGDPRQRVRG